MKEGRKESKECVLEEEEKISSRQKFISTEYGRKPSPPSQSNHGGTLRSCKMPTHLGNEMKKHGGKESRVYCPLEGAKALSGKVGDVEGKR